MEGPLHNSVYNRDKYLNPILFRRRRRVAIVRRMELFVVAVHIHSLGELQRTVWALERRGLGVEADVGLEGAGMGKGLGAQLALDALLGVDAHVIAQRAALPKRLAALTAGKRTLALVHQADMPSQVAVLGKAAIAHGAAIGLLPRMFAEVHFQAARVGKGLVATLTLVQFRHMCVRAKSVCFVVHGNVRVAVITHSTTTKYVAHLCFSMHLFSR